MEPLQQWQPVPVGPAAALDLVADEVPARDVVLRQVQDLDLVQALRLERYLV
jgi:hypothetical protein